jgi:hypothetical protein
MKYILKWLTLAVRHLARREIVPAQNSAITLLAAPVWDDRQKRCRAILRVSTAVAAACASADSQVPEVWTVQTSNLVQYHFDAPDPVKFATLPGVTPRAAVANFYPLIDLSDVVAINGKPAKGTVALWGSGLSLAPSPQPGQAVADVNRVAVYEFRLDILDASGTPVGTIVGSGLGGGPPAPGLSSGFGTLAITGGTGAFLGISGQFAFVGQQASRRASMLEDPANRRTNGGGSPGGWLLHLIPRTRPQVLQTANGPAVLHANDFTPVTTYSPARAGEILSLFATGLGPTRPGIDPGKLFPSNPTQAVNSPVEVTVDGKVADVLAAVGYPGSADGYQVNFRMPVDSSPGPAALKLSAAWIGGPEVQIPVR